MKTLWINVLGFSSGRTAFVLTDGKPPYKKNTNKPVGTEHGILDRFSKADFKKLRKMAKGVNKVNILNYADNTTYETLKPKKFRKLMDSCGMLNDPIVEMMPSDDEDKDE